MSKKSSKMLSNTLRLNFCYLKIIHILYPLYHPIIRGHILKDKIASVKKQVCLYSWDYTINHNRNEDKNQK